MTPKVPSDRVNIGTDDVPEGWAVVPLGYLVGSVQPGFACGKNNRDGEGVGHVRPMNVSRDGKMFLPDLKYVPASEARRDERLLKRGDVVFNNTNSSELVGKTAYYDHVEPLAFSNHMTRIRCHEEVLEPRYCAAALHHWWRTGYFEAVCNNHVSQASVGQDVLRETKIALPPLGEQRRIVGKLDHLLSQVASAHDHLSRAPTILKRFRHAVLAAACSGRLTEDWREEHAEVEPSNRLLAKIADLRQRRVANRRPATRPLSENTQSILSPPIDLPASWAWCRVDQVATICLGGTPSRKMPCYWGGSVPWVSSGEVANCRIGVTRENITTEGLTNSNAKVYPKNTVLIAMIGEGKTRGQSAILDIEASTNQNVAGLLLDHEDINPDYIWYWALSEYERNRAVGRGGSQPALNGEKVRALPLPLPPNEEQVEIVNRVRTLLDRVDAIEGRVTTSVSLTEKLTQSILAKAFRGELVPTEAELARREGREYEPASVLLERIKKQREQADGNSPKRKRTPPKIKLATARG